MSYDCTKIERSFLQQNLFCDMWDIELGPASLVEEHSFRNILYVGIDRRGIDWNRPFDIIWLIMANHVEFFFDCLMGELFF